MKGRHFKTFGKLAKNTKKLGVGGKRLLQLIIKYVPKYILFYRNMKGVLILKFLRQIHFAKKIFRSLNANPEKEEDDDDDDEDEDSVCIEEDDTAESEGDTESLDDFCEDDFEDDDDVSFDSSEFTSEETDYESCIDDDDEAEFVIHFTNIPSIRATLSAPE